MRAYFYHPCPECDAYDRPVLGPANEGRCVHCGALVYEWSRAAAAKRAADKPKDA